MDLEENMKEAYDALIFAAGQAGEDYEKYKSDSYWPIYVNKKIYWQSRLS